MTMPSITIEIRTVYGNRSIYPVCDTARLFAQIAGTKTLTASALDVIRSLGYQVQVKQQTL